MGLLWTVVAGAIAGWLAGQFMKSGGSSLAGDIVVGIIGAFVGGYAFRAFGMDVGSDLLGSLLVAFVGALVLLIVVRLVTGRRAFS